MTGFDLLVVDCTAADAPQRLTESMRDTGFAVLSNHGIPAAEIDKAYTGWAEFFASQAKHDYTVAQNASAGFFPFRSENAKDAPAKDLKEFFHFYPGGPLPDGLEALTRAMHDQLVALGGRLLGWIEDNTPADVRARFSEPLPAMVYDSPSNLLRILHYPPLQGAPEEAGAERAAAHEDINLITLLVAGSAPGLQAQDSTGTWHDVPCDPGMITVNVGDMLEKASGGYYPSTTHRVVNPAADPSGPGNTSRYSMPMFLHPRAEVRLDEHYTADAYLQERLREIGLKG
jgi:isopenicillin N synthase-like dioxygenase